MMPSQHPIREAYRGSMRYALGPSQVVVHEDGLLIIDLEGKIVACDAFEKLSPRLPENCKVHDHRGCWIIPGFVDCHVHLPQLDCRNKNGLTLLDWLKVHVFPVEAQFSDPKIAREIAPRFYDELLSHGITTAAIYSTVHFEATDLAFQFAHARGMRAIIGQVLMDQNAPSDLLRPATQLLRESEKLIEKWNGKEGRLFFAVTPRFALTCSKKLLEGAGRLTQEAGVRFQTHLAETKEEVEQAKGIHPFTNYAAFYEKNNCLGGHSLFAHCIYLQEDEWKVLGQHNVAVAHCPTSNVFLKSGMMPVAEVERHGLRFGLGSDVGAGPTFSMQEIAECACKVHPAGNMTPQKAFYLATLGGAEALSLANQIGNFAEGKWADFSIFKNADFKGKAKAVFVAGKMICGDV